MERVIKNLVGMRYGLLSVDKMIASGNHKTVLWECTCNCGKKITISTSELTSGKIISCGCIKKNKKKCKKWIPRIEGNIYYIPLTQGYEAIIDKNKFYLIKDYKWHYDKGYARTSINHEKIYMHSILLNIKGNKNIDCDHRLGNTLDNRMSEIRIATPTLNGYNQKPKNRDKGTRKAGNGFDANIVIKGKNYYLGHFDTQIEASEAYDLSSLENHDGYHRLNYPENIEKYKEILKNKKEEGIAYRQLDLFEQ